MKDKLFNHWLSVSNFFKVITNNPPRNPFSIPKVDFSKITKEQLLQSFLPTQPWGDYHPGKLIQWYDPSGIKVTNRGIELSVTDNFLSSKDGLIPFGVGLICSKEAYTYGIYEWDITLPKGRQLWPAVWLTNYDTWPPEIDVIEAYSNDKSNYGNRLNTNIYLGDSDESQYQLKAMSHGLLINLTERINLKLVWFEEGIQIYYNDYLVRQITDEKSLKWLNVNPKMRVIINAGLREVSDFQEMNQSPFIIHSFGYLKYN